MRKICEILKSFFCNSEGKFNPPYFWVSLLLLLAVINFVMKMTGIDIISDTLLISIQGFVLGWLGVYNWGKKRNGM
jgi:hypothetical protein